MPKRFRLAATIVVATAAAEKQDDPDNAFTSAAIIVATADIANAVAAAIVISIATEKKN